VGANPPDKTPRFEQAGNYTERAGEKQTGENERGSGEKGMGRGEQRVMGNGKERGQAPFLTMRLLNLFV